MPLRTWRTSPTTTSDLASPISAKTKSNLSRHYSTKNNNNSLVFQENRLPTSKRRRGLKEIIDEDRRQKLNRVGDEEENRERDLVTARRDEEETRQAPMAMEVE